MKRFSLLLASLCLLVLPGCAGYSLGAQKPAHLRHVTKLAIPTFKNQTLEQRLSAEVTNAIIKQVQNQGAYQIVARKDAEAVLEGTIQQIQRSQFRSDRNNILRTSQILATLNCSYSIKDTAGTLLHNGSASADSYIILDSNLQLSETQLLEDAAQRLANTVADDISEGW